MVALCAYLVNCFEMEDSWLNARSIENNDCSNMPQMFELLAKKQKATPKFNDVTPTVSKFWKGPSK